MEKLKILGISPFNRLWYAKTGGTPTLYNLIKGFIDAGDEVHLLCPFDKKENFCLKGLYVHRFKLPFNNFKSNRKVLNGIYSKILYFLFVLLTASETLKITKKMKPDIIYGFTGWGAATAYLIAKIRNIPNITRLFGTFLYPFIKNPFQLLLRFDEFLAFKIPCEYLIITNDGTKGDKVAKQSGVSEEKLKFWMNGVDDMYMPDFNVEKFKDSLGIPKNKKIILAVNRLVSWKRIDRIINVIPLVVSQYKNVIFLIVGDGDEKMRLENLVDKLKIKDYVKFIGAVPHNEVKYYMNSADVFISLNDLSNVGNPLLEAMKCGKCVVTLNTGATAEIIKNDENGILLDIDNINNLPNIIIQLLNDDKSRDRLGHNARKYALEHFQTWDERIQMEIKFVEKLYSKNGKK